ncbi:MULTISPECIES: hypothetical protein [unclassified Spirillospora]|uniref:hypothetical protein n=1 Tax=unclassified Spirillospora TaxID=2642701 RepID=UPI0037129990
MSDADGIRGAALPLEYEEDLDPVLDWIGDARAHVLLRDIQDGQQRLEKTGHTALPAQGGRCEALTIEAPPSAGT